jgi:localization factor PodJL
MHNLGFFYAQGMGGLKKDGTAAQKWFKSAAEQGLVASQVNLAIILSQNAQFDLQPQMDQAYYWSAIAAKSGDEEAERMRDALAGALSAEVKAQMDQDVQKWKAKPVKVIANGGFDASPEAFMPPEQRPALTQAELKSVQQMLNQLGFNAGSADGRPGAQTENAIKAFQAAYDLPQTGAADRDVLAALKAIPH